MKSQMRSFRVMCMVFAVIVCTAAVAAAMGGAAKAPDITIEAPEAMASPALLGVVSVFMKIVNAGGPDTLVSARVNVPKAVVELHDVKDRRMIKVDYIKIPKRSTVELKPGSLHIMIFELPKDIKEGGKLELTLVFERSGEKNVPVEILSRPGQMMHHHGH